MRTLACLAFSLLGSAPAWPQENFSAQAIAHYQRGLEAYSRRGGLDTDRALLVRSQAIMARLSTAASKDWPESRAWPWEIHVADDPVLGAYAMAGGKVLVGAQFVSRLKLDDPALAMLLAHEMAHLLAGHRRARLPDVGNSMDVDPAGEVLAQSEAVAQEEEADFVGMRLALAAGWPAPALLRFFDVLAADEPPGTFNASHPRAADRAMKVRARLPELAPPK